MNKHTITVAAFAAACLAGSTAYAGPTAPAKKIVEPTPESCITGDIGFDIVSNYVTKGIVQQNQGFIIQPYADLHFRIFKGAGALTSITADIGIWNSMQGHHPGVAGTVPNWYEFDFQTGLTFNINKFSIGGYFKTYESPTSQFQTAYTAGINLAFDDSAALGNFALHPYALIELELQGTSGNNNPFAAGVPGSVPSYHGRGQYYEVGIAPGHTWGAFSLSLPVKVGFGSGGFYLGNRGYGYVGVGVAAGYALNFVPACLGKWSLSSSVTYYRLNGNNNPVNPSGAAGLGFGAPITDKNQLVFQGGLKVAF
jgi:hypothetical protein